MFHPELSAGFRSGPQARGHDSGAIWLLFIIREGSGFGSTLAQRQSVDFMSMHWKLPPMQPIELVRVFGKVTGPHRPFATLLATRYPSTRLGWAA